MVSPEGSIDPIRSLTYSGKPPYVYSIKVALVLRFTRFTFSRLVPQFIELTVDHSLNVYSINVSLLFNLLDLRFTKSSFLYDY